MHSIQQQQYTQSHDERKKTNIPCVSSVTNMTTHQYVLCETIVGELPKVTAARVGILAHVRKCYSRLLLEPREDPEVIEAKSHLMVYRKDTQQWTAGWKSPRRLLGWSETDTVTVTYKMLNALSKRFDIYLGVGFSNDFEFRKDELLLCRLGPPGDPSPPTADPETNLQVTYVSVQENDAVIRWSGLIETRVEKELMDEETVVGAHSTNVPGDCDLPVPTPLVQDVVNVCRQWMNNPQVIWTPVETTIQEADIKRQRRYARGRRHGPPGDPFVRFQWTASLWVSSNNIDDDGTLVTARLFYWDNEEPFKCIVALEIQYGTNNIGHLLASLSGSGSNDTLQKQTQTIEKEKITATIPANDEGGAKESQKDGQKNPNLWKAAGRKMKQHKVGKAVLTGIRDAVDSAKGTVASSLFPQETNTNVIHTNEDETPTTTNNTPVLTAKIPTSNFGLVCGHEEDHPICESRTFAYLSSDGCANDTAFDKSQPITAHMVLLKLVEDTKGYCLGNGEEIEDD